MGKLIDIGKTERDRRQKIAAPNVTFCGCCTPVASYPSCSGIKDGIQTGRKTFEHEELVVHKELVVIGAGPHALTLILRLLEPEADLMTDKDRHVQADYKQRMRPLSQVRNHIKDIMKGPAGIYKQSKRSKKAKSSSDPIYCPALSLDYVKENVLVVDGSVSQEDTGIHGWMAGWKKNFEALNITQLRSSISAHADPYDHRAIEFFGAHMGRDKELIPLDHMPKETHRWAFKGPYNSPTTQIFHDFHRKLITAYGVEDMVKSGTVETIRCTTPAGGAGSSSEDHALFELTLSHPSGQKCVVKTPRVVCAMGPAYGKSEPLLSRMALDSWQLPNRILQAHQIIPFLKKAQSTESKITNQSILVVGGGITSAHIALTCADECKCPWCKSVTLIQRSKLRERQFDLDASWMGPGRGRHLENFWNQTLDDRATRLKEERGGGSIPPEIVQLLRKAVDKSNRLVIEEETEIMDVQYDCRADRLLVSMDNGLPEQSFDMIWLATGPCNHIDNYPVLQSLMKDLPVDIVGGLPVLNKDLSWKPKDCADDNSVAKEPEWKLNARKRLWIMGPLAGLELGPDALNLMGARQGAVRIAKVLREDLCANETIKREIGAAPS